MVLNEKFYAILKWTMFLATPVLTFVLGVVAAISTGDVTAIITAIIGGLGTLAGAIIKISDTNYKKN